MTRLQTRDSVYRPPVGALRRSRPLPRDAKLKFSLIKALHSPVDRRTDVRRDGYPHVSSIRANLNVPFQDPTPKGSKSIFPQTSFRGVRGVLTRELPCQPICHYYPGVTLSLIHVEHAAYLDCLSINGDSTPLSYPSD